MEISKEAKRLLQKHPSLPPFLAWLRTQEEPMTYDEMALKLGLARPTVARATRMLHEVRLLYVAGHTPPHPRTSAVAYKWLACKTGKEEDKEIEVVAKATDLASKLLAKGEPASWITGLVI